MRPARQPAPGSDITGGVAESDLDGSVVKGVVVQMLPQPQIVMSGRSISFLKPLEPELASSKRVICGICHKNNEVPLRTCLLDCGACGGRNSAGNDTALRVACFNCFAPNLADPDAAHIKCGKCG